MKLDSKIPSGHIEQKWDNYRFNAKLVNPANRKKFDVIIVGTGLAGASAAASLGEAGYNVMVFTLHDTPRRAHSIAAQGGINAAKNYKYDGDSVYRLFYDTLKGGDYRAREANVYRLAQISTQIIDHCVAIGVPFAREYGGLLDTRSFGGAQLQRTFYARGQTGQQLLLGAYSQMMRQVANGTVKIFPRREMMDLIVKNGKARGIIVRNLITGEIEAYSAHAVILATGGYSNVFYLSTNAATCNVSAAWKCYKKGAGFANPCFTQIHPTCIPRSGDHQSKLTLMSESLRNDGRVWVPKIKGDTRHPNDIPEEERDYYLERMYPSFGNLVPRDIASRAAKRMVDAGYGVGPTKEAVYLDFRDAIKKQGKEKIKEKYGNLFDMYYRITDEDAYSVPMRIYPAPHYTMGGLWVDYELMSTIPGLFVLGEANFSDHGANRLGASALMQGLADGYFIISATLPNYLANTKFEEIHLEDDEFKYSINEVKEKIKKILSIKGNKTPTEFHKELGKIMWEYCGMARNEEGLKKALRMIPSLKEEFMENLKIVGDDKFNQVLEKALRVYDFIEFAELLLKDALHRKESCGGHFREEYQTPDGEAKRDDENFAYVAVWEYKGDNKEPELHKEKLEFEYLKPTTRSYK
jgi:succinate dehydrogenase / fumarate reductase flavoprotein subunit